MYCFWQMKSDGTVRYAVELNDETSAVVQAFGPIPVEQTTRRNYPSSPLHPLSADPVLVGYLNANRDNFQYGEPYHE